MLEDVLWDEGAARTNWLLKTMATRDGLVRADTGYKRRRENLREVPRTLRFLAARKKAAATKTGLLKSADCFRTSGRPATKRVR